MKQWLLLYVVMITFTFSVQGIAQNIVHDRNTVHLKKLKKVVLVYFHDFPYRKPLNTQSTSECFVTLNLLSTFGSIIKKVWRCREHIILLRSEKLINQWQQKQNNNGFFYFNLPGSGIRNIPVHIESASSIENNIPTANLFSKKAGIVTGIFLRHTTNIRTYTFQSPVTGKTSKISATPDHPFYVKNLHLWLSLHKITPTMILTDSYNNPVILQCPNHRRYHCGAPLLQGRISTIYNLEVHKKYTYFVGRQSLLVHNCGNLKSASGDKYDRLLEIEQFNSVVQPFIYKSLDALTEDMFKFQSTDLSHVKITEETFNVFIQNQVRRAINSHNARMDYYGLGKYKLNYAVSDKTSTSKNTHLLFSFFGNDSNQGNTKHLATIKYHFYFQTAKIVPDGTKSTLYHLVLNLAKSTREYADDLKVSSQLIPFIPYNIDFEKLRGANVYF